MSRRRCCGAVGCRTTSTPVRNLLRICPGRWHAQERRGNGVSRSKAGCDAGVCECGCVQDEFPGFIQRVVRLREGQEMRTHESVAYLVFMINLFQVTGMDRPMLPCSR
jgi:hypothetical protein